MTTTVVKESLKEALLGTEEEPQLSYQTRLDFLKHAVRDDDSSEYYMTEDRFIDAIAPESEDYVCTSTNPPHLALFLSHGPSC